LPSCTGIGLHWPGVDKSDGISKTPRPQNYGYGLGFAKVRYRGIAKNAERLYVACALVNIFQLRRPLLRLAL